MPDPSPLAGGRLRLDVPAGWRVRETAGPRPFVTRAVLVAPDGSLVEWTSRRHRKGLDVVAGRSRPAGGLGFVGRASATSWWMGGLFAVGSLLFAVGSLPPYFDRVDPDVVAWTFFVGSIAFTSAGYLQYHEAANAPTSISGGRDLRAWRLSSLLRLQPHRIAWWAALVQLVGTVFFNVSTFAATRDQLSSEQVRRLVWGPDVWGSICFLVASWLAYSEICPRLRQRPDWTVEWWIGALNLAGSVFFGFSAIGARYLPTTGETANIVLVNLGTFAGAVCFLAGAVLLPVESAGVAARR